MKLRVTRRATYGPYSENLRHVLRPLEGHLISGYKDGGDAPGKQLNLVPGAVEDAAAFLDGYPDTKKRVERVTQLVDGFESSFGLELLSTVHWVASENVLPCTDDEVIAHTYAWGSRKRQFTERQIRLALQVLDDNGWFQTSPKVGGSLVNCDATASRAFMTGRTGGGSPVARRTRRCVGSEYRWWSSTLGCN